MSYVNVIKVMLMQSKLLYIPVIAIIFCSFLGNGNETSGIESKSWIKSWAKVQEGVWMKKTEVSNADFKLFLNDLKEQGRLQEWKAFYPDTTVWVTGNSASKPFVEFYFNSTAFNNYPVVGISFEAANAYCSWLSNKYAVLNNQPFGKVMFRLPNQDEWKKGASSSKDDGRVYPWNGLYLHNNRGERLCNFKAENDSLVVMDAGSKKNQESQKLPPTKAQITSPVNSFFPNDIGLYNVCGNVAEMLAEKGIAAGGGFDDAGYNVRIQSTKNYNNPSREIGFRVLMQSTAQ